MFIRVDGSDVVSDLEGYSYVDEDNTFEMVKFSEYVDCVVELCNDKSEQTYGVYVKDIPNLIKALQAAYDFKTK